MFVSLKAALIISEEKSNFWILVDNLIISEHFLGLMVLFNATHPSASNQSIQTGETLSLRALKVQNHQTKSDGSYHWHHETNNQI